MIVYESTQTYTRVGEITHANLDQPYKVFEYMKDAFESHPLQEQVWVIMLNRKNFPIARERVTIGSTTAAHLDPSMVFRPAILAGSTAVILAHNHPSGDPTASVSDKVNTMKLIKCGKLLNIGVLDHVVIGHNQFYSMCDEHDCDFC
jgi:DNA repair protein RadC